MTILIGGRSTSGVLGNGRGTLERTWAGETDEMHQELYPFHSFARLRLGFGGVDPSKDSFAESTRTAILNIPLVFCLSFGSRTNRLFLFDPMDSKSTRQALVTYSDYSSRSQSGHGNFRRGSGKR